MVVLVVQKAAISPAVTDLQLKTSGETCTLNVPTSHAESGPQGAAGCEGTTGKCLLFNRLT